MRSHSIIERLQECAPRVLERFPVLFAYVYGSYAAGEAHRFSDLDIAVFVSGDAPDGLMRLEADIALAFDKVLDHLINTDVRAVNHLPLAVKGGVVTEGIILYSCDEEARVDFETRVRMAYFDFQPAMKAYRVAYIAAARDSG